MDTLLEIIREELEGVNNDIDKVQSIADNLIKEPRSKNDILANVDINKADLAFQRDLGYYISKGESGIGQRRLKIRDLINSGELKYAPIANIIMRNGEPILSFTDGRHRFAELRDMGAKSINLAFRPEARQYINLLQ